MVYTSTSIKEIIGRLIRNIKLSDLSLADDMLEWIPEGLDKIGASPSMERCYSPIAIKDYTGKLPSGIQSLYAVIYEGSRLRYGHSIMDPRLDRATRDKEISNQFVFKLDVTSEFHINQGDYEQIRGLDLKGLDYSQHNREFYYIQMDHIKTSFKEDEVVGLYLKRPTDEEGYPLIPDIEWCKEALFWYLMRQMMLGGYKHPDHNINYMFCDTQFVRYARKARNRMNAKSVDREESILRATVRLVPPDNYYSQFHINAEQPL